MMGSFWNWNDENIKRFDAIEAKLETQLSLKNEQICRLQSQLNEKAEIITILKDKVERMEEKNYTKNFTLKCNWSSKNIFG